MVVGLSFGGIVVVFFPIPTSRKCFNGLKVSKMVSLFRFWGFSGHLVILVYKLTNHIRIAEVVFFGECFKSRAGIRRQTEVCHDGLFYYWFKFHSVHFFMMPDLPHRRKKIITRESFFFSANKLTLNRW